MYDVCYQDLAKAIDESHTVYTIVINNFTKGFGQGSLFHAVLKSCERYGKQTHRFLTAALIFFPDKQQDCLSSAAELSARTNFILMLY